MPDPTQPAFWSQDSNTVLSGLKTTAGGLTAAEATQRLATYGPNRLTAARRTDALSLFLGQFKSPIILILIFATLIAYFTGDHTTAAIILSIVLASGLLGFIQERGANNAVQKLLAMVQVKAEVLRDGQKVEILLDEIVPGDVVLFSAGDLVPADCLLLESQELYVDEATLTGESLPVEKQAGVLPADTVLAKRTNSLFMGTHAVSGTASAVVVNTGKQTEFGHVSARLQTAPPMTEFEAGVDRFGKLLMVVTLVLVTAIFLINVVFHKPMLDSFLFALALAVGLTPQLLPAIITVNLSQGAKRMAKEKVIVKRLSSIENFGSMNVLCSDKTGTLTAGDVRLKSALDAQGRDSDRVLLYAYLNASFESGFTNPIDQAICTGKQFDVSAYKKLSEVHYDFTRRRLSVLVAQGDQHLMIAKGALQGILSVCTQVEQAEGQIVSLDSAKDEIQKEFESLSNQGFRTMGVAYRDMGPAETITAADEAGMIFLGYLVLFDPPKPDVAKTVADLKNLGVSLVLITGDNPLVAAAVARQVGGFEPVVVSGAELKGLSGDALVQKIKGVNVFAEVEPQQKEDLIRAQRAAGNVVGFMGDGINDAPALHAADVGLSVNTAVDVAKEAAAIVLMEEDLSVLIGGVREGRTTFANTLKYVFMATGANFGNMFSMAGASLFLKFLPLLPGQILLTNLLTDFPEMTIATDRVDLEMETLPQRWNIAFIRDFMLIFGPLSSVFDFATFGVLFLVLGRLGLHQTDALFQQTFHTCWFVESVISAALIVLVVRTRRAFFLSPPSTPLLGTTLAVCVATVILPYTPLGTVLGFVPLAGVFYWYLAGIVGLYILSAEILKRWFYRRVLM
jgi:Mg2+-importing ATPase